MKDPLPWSYSEKRLRRAKAPPAPLVNELPATCFRCRCGRLWASAAAKAQHVEQAHGGVEPDNHLQGEQP